MAPILYKFDASPPSNALRVLADILGLELELRDMNFSSLEHKSPGHVKLNPMGTVPTLIDGDFVISESHATMKYLLSVYGGDKSEQLYPSDVRTRALVDQAMFFNVGIFFIRLKVIVIPPYRCMVGQIRSTPIIPEVPRSRFQNPRRSYKRGLAEK